MNKTIIVSFAILSLSTSAALAAKNSPCQEAACSDRGEHNRPDEFLHGERRR